MAVRGTPGRRMVGNPLGGILRDLDRRTRMATRRSGKRAPGGASEAEPAPAVPGPPGPRGPRGLAGRGVLACVELVTGEDGRARWDLPDTGGVVPVVSAVCVAEEPSVATLESVTAGLVVVRVWSVSSGRARVRAVVHLTAAVPGGGGG